MLLFFFLFFFYNFRKFTDLQLLTGYRTIRPCYRAWLQIVVNKSVGDNAACMVWFGYRETHSSLDYPEHLLLSLVCTLPPVNSRLPH